MSSIPTTTGTTSGGTSGSSTTSTAGVPLFASETDSWIMVRVKDNSKPGSYLAKFARMPVYFDSFQHTPTSPIINVQFVIWSPGDTEASVTIIVG